MSEKKIIVTHSWEDNPSRPDIKADTWTEEAEFNEDGSISIIRRNKLLTIKLNKDGTLSVSLGRIDGSRHVSGNLKKMNKNI